MVKCCVPGCDSVGKRIFHAFPANQELRQKWINLTKTSNLAKKDFIGYAKVCRYHFKETDFVRNHRNQRGLKPNTVPSLRLPSLAATVPPPSYSLDHNYAAKDRKEKELWKRRYGAVTIPSVTRIQQKEKYVCIITFTFLQDFLFDVQTIEIRDDSFSIESNQWRDKEFEKFKMEAAEDKRKIRELENELRVYKQRLIQTERKLTSKNDKLGKAREKLKTTKLNRNNVFRYLRTVFCEEQLAFFNMQLRNEGRRPAGRRYTAEEKSLALILYKHSPKNYRFMRKIFTLPDKRTLGRHSAQLMFRTGVNSKIFELIKEKADAMTENERCCATSWDEISLKPHLDYNIPRDEIDGFVDLATIRKPVFGTHSLTFMIRSIDSTWKQAVGYFITDGLKSFELVELIKLMTKAVLETGLKVMMSVCDQVSVNSSAIRQLVNSSLPKQMPSTGLLSYTIGNTSIIHCYDPPHLIKVIRNNLMTKDLEHSIVERWNINRGGGQCGNSNKNRKRIASWEHVKCFCAWGNKSGSKLLPKITTEHINPEKLKMKVSVATQIFSESVGNAMLKYSYDKDLPQNLNDTAQILLFFNDVFDSINGSSEIGKNELKGPVTVNSVHFAFWNFALEMIAKMQWIDKETKTPTNTTSVLKKFQSTILGYIEICRLCLNMNMKKVALSSEGTPACAYLQPRLKMIYVVSAERFRLSLFFVCSLFTSRLFNR
ncbi:hypothetical protein HA402_013132 [Bradysia odoriphaga]|nr:hypothetical protein HA402_013132 [Bradysia odoriphaga]